MKAHKNLKGLIKVMQSAKDGSRSAEAAKALGEIGDASVIQPLLDEYRAGHYHSSDAAAGALIEMARRTQEVDLTTRLLNEWIAALCPGGLVYSGSLVHYDGDDDEFNREWAKEDQRRIRRRQIWDMGAGRRQAAARALGEMRDARAVDPLVQCLKTHRISSYDDHTRRFAAEALVKIGDPRAIQPLQETLQDIDESMQGNVIAALKKLGDSR
jgi:HEAT repeat protein